MHKPARFMLLQKRFDFELRYHLEFNSTDDMNKKIDESETLKGMIKDVQNSDFVNKNCILLFSLDNTVTAILYPYQIFCMLLRHYNLHLRKPIT